MDHPTYHHFIGNTSSSIDVILQKTTNSDIPQEAILGILCSRSSHQVDSKHDIILSSFQLRFNPPSPIQSEKNPRILNNKHKIIWSEEGILSYRELIAPTLLSLKENWSNPESSISFSILLQCTNEALTSAAKATNKVINLAKDYKPRKSPLIPADVATAEKQKLQSHKNLQAVLQDPDSSDLDKSSAKHEFSTARKSHRRIWRRHQFSLESSNYAKTHEILSNDPKNAFKHLKSLKSTASGKIPELKAGDNIYYGENVADGFFQNIKHLKTMNSDTKACESCLNIKFDYSLIIDLCKAGQKIPSITLVKAEELLHAL